MKKIFTLLCIALIFLSCNSDDSVTTETPSVMQPDPTKLQKVVFFPETTYKKELDFYENGLVKEIRTSSVSVQTFAYDSNNNLTNTTITSTGSVPVIVNFTYDSQNHITTINGENIHYDSTQNAYVTANNGGAFTEYFLDNNGLFNYEIHHLGREPEEDEPTQDYGASATQIGNNTTSLDGNYEWSSRFSHDNKTNPLKAAFLPACKAISLIYFGDVLKKLLNSEYNSVNNVTEIRFSPEDPESAKVTYMYNALNLPVTSTRGDYFQDELEGTRIYIKYYYQGEEIPQ